MKVSKNDVYATIEGIRNQVGDISLMVKYNLNEPQIWAIETLYLTHGLILFDELYEKIGEIEPDFIAEDVEALYDIDY